MSRLSLYSSFFLFLGVCAAQAEGHMKEYSLKDDLYIIILVTLFFGCGCFCVTFMRLCLVRGGYNETYLHARGTTAAGGGLDASVVETFPTFSYSTVKTLRIVGGKDECHVCLNAFEEDETLRLMPQCRHVFHTGCIDAWLRCRATCPLCRANLVPIPGRSVIVDIPGLVRETGQTSLDGDDNRKRVLGSLDERLIDSVDWSSNQRMPRRSMSTGSKLASQSGSTDHRVVN